MAIQIRVIGALLLREIITRYGRDNLGFVWLFLEPMIFTVMITALWFSIGLGHASPIPIVAFAITGYSSVLLWRNCATRCSMAVQPNVGLLYHRYVRVLDLLLARIILEISGATVSFIVLATFWITIGWMELPNNVLLVICGWLLLAWFGAGLALIFGALTAYSELAERLWHPLAYIMFPLSGAMFMVDWFPSHLQEYLLLIPMLHGVEMLREGYFGPVIATHYDAGYLIAFCLYQTLLGLAIVRDASRRLRFQ